MCFQKQKCLLRELLSLLGQLHIPKDQLGNLKLMKMIFSTVGETNSKIPHTYSSKKTRGDLVELKKSAMNGRSPCTTACKTKLQDVISILKLLCQFLRKFKSLLIKLQSWKIYLDVSQGGVPFGNTAHFYHLHFCTLLL